MEKKVALTVREHVNYKRTLRCAKEAGFKYINMGFGDSVDLFVNDKWKFKIEEIGNEIAKNGLKAVNTHSPYYNLLISSEVQDERLNLAQIRCLEATKMLGADICAFHPRTHFNGSADLDLSFEDNKRNFSPLVDEAVKFGVKVGIENIPIFPNWGQELFSCYTRDQNRIIDYFKGSNAVCAVWDTGHSNLMKYNQIEAILDVGSRIEATHIHNNFKIEDDHFMPSIGTIDWYNIALSLKKIGYKGYFTCESTICDNDMMEECIQHIFDCLCKIEKLFCGV